MSQGMGKFKVALYLSGDELEVEMVGARLVAPYSPAKDLARPNLRIFRDENGNLKWDPAGRENDPVLMPCGGWFTIFNETRDPVDFFWPAAASKLLNHQIRMQIPPRMCLQVQIKLDAPDETFLLGVGYGDGGGPVGKPDPPPN